MLLKKEKTSFESPDRLNRIVEGTKLMGEMIADSNIRIDGEVIGNVTCAGKVVVGENGKITGNLTCNEADVEGLIEGDVQTDTLLCLREKSKVVGNIQTAKIEINQGAVFLGNCSMGSTNKRDKGVPVQNRKTQPEDIVY
jgi:cytoskeletal protein CcmA (bactofilin family)